VQQSELSQAESQQLSPDKTWWREFTAVPPRGSLLDRAYLLPELPLRSVADCSARTPQQAILRLQICLARLCNSPSIHQGATARQFAAGSSNPIYEQPRSQVSSVDLHLV